MRILVTGGSGFLGTHLCDRLVRDGHEVFNLDVVRGPAFDIREPLDQHIETLEGYQACVHLAAIAAPRECAANPRNAWLTNVLGTHNVLRLCERSGIRRVTVMSSAHVYGISPLYMPTDERAPLVFQDPYTDSKRMTEAVAQAFWENYGLSYCAVRLYNAFGPGQNEAYFLGAKIREAMAGDFVVKGAEITKDWVFVDDVIDALVRTLDSDFVGPVNVGTGIETSLQTLAKQIAASFGRTVEVAATDDLGPSRMCADWGRARRVLGWQPTVSVREGLARTIQEVAA